MYVPGNGLKQGSSQETNEGRNWSRLCVGAYMVLLPALNAGQHLLLDQDKQVKESNE